MTAIDEGAIAQLADQASRLMAAGWRGNPNMSGDDRDFMTAGMRRRHDERVRSVVDFVLSQVEALRPGSTGETEGWRDVETDRPPTDRAVLVYGRPKDTEDLSFKAPQVHLAYWDTIDGAFCLDGGTWLGPFIKPTHWRPLPEPPSAMLAGGTE